MTLLERDECGTDEGDLAYPATPSIFTEACNNETYMEVGGSASPMAGGGCLLRARSVFGRKAPVLVPLCPSAKGL